MVLAAGLGPVGYVFAIFHLLCHGFFKAGLFLGAGSVMHGMKDQRQHAALRRAARRHGHHLVTFFLRLPRDHRHPAVLRLLLQGQDHRGGVLARLSWSGSSRSLGAGITAFYMTRMVVMTFFGPPRWLDDVAPARVPKIMTVPMIFLALRSVFARLLLDCERAIINWLEPVTGFARTELVISAHGIECITFAVVLVGGDSRWMMYGRREVPVDAARRLAAHPRRPRGALRQRVQRGRVHAPGPVADPLARVLRQPRRRRRRQRRRRAARRPVQPRRVASRPASPAPTPCPCSSAPPSWSAPCSW